jgi:hypothetical protein
MTATDDPAERLQQFLAALEELPEFTGLTFRGCPDDAEFVRPGQLTVLTTVVSTSREIDVATEGRAIQAVYAIASRTGREITAFSARPEEREVVLLPGAVLLLERSKQVADIAVHLVTEVRPTAEPVRASDADVDRLAGEVETQLRARGPQPARPFDSIPGKFSGDLSTP